MCLYHETLNFKVHKKQHKWSTIKCFAMVICQYAMQIPNDGQKLEWMSTQNKSHQIYELRDIKTYL